MKEITDYKISNLPVAPLYQQFLDQALSKQSYLEEHLNLEKYNEVVHGQRDAKANSRVNPVLANFFVDGFSPLEFESVKVYNGHLVPLIAMGEKSIDHISGYTMLPSHALTISNVFRLIYSGEGERRKIC